jgi:hypothetical protein
MKNWKWESCFWKNFGYTEALYGMQDPLNSISIALASFALWL